MERSDPRFEANQIRAGYDQMWKQAYPDLVRGVVNTDPIPDDTSQRWGVSIIARIPSVHAPRFTDIRDTLRSWTGDDHTLYDTYNLHTTIRSCEFYRNVILPNDDARIDYQRVLHEVAAQIPSFTITYRGLSANRTGIIVQGFPQTDHLQQLRRMLQQQLAQRGRIQGPEMTSIRRGAHVSLVVFAGPLVAPQRLATYIDDHRPTDYGEVTIANVDLVHYRRTHQDVVIESFTHVELQGI